MAEAEMRKWLSRSLWALAFVFLCLTLPASGAWAAGQGCPGFATQVKVVTTNTYSLTGPDQCMLLIFTEDNTVVTVPPVGWRGDLIAGFMTRVFNTSNTALTFSGSEVNNTPNLTIAPTVTADLYIDGRTVSWFASTTGTGGGGGGITSVAGDQGIFTDPSPITSTGTVKCHIITDTQLGCARVDGTTIVADGDGILTAIGGGGGGVTSVGLSSPGGIFSITGTNPITTSGTFGYLTTGTSGGIPYFSSTSILSSSSLLSLNGFVLGGGSGGAPTSTQITGLVLGAGSSTPGAYGGTTCTNQFVRALNTSGVATCATVGTLDISLATLSHDATFSGTSYNGSVARTWGINLGNPNSWLAQQAVTPVALSIVANSVAMDAALSNDFTLTANDNFTLENPTNLAAGQTINIWITQDATGSRLITWGTFWQAVGGSNTMVLSTTPGTKDLATCVSDTTTSLTCSLLKGVAH